MFTRRIYLAARVTYAKNGGRVAVISIVVSIVTDSCFFFRCALYIHTHCRRRRRRMQITRAGDTLSHRGFSMKILWPHIRTINQSSRNWSPQPQSPPLFEIDRLWVLGLWQ